MGQLGYTASQTGHCAGWADEESRLGEGEEKMDYRYNRAFAAQMTHGRKYSCRYAIRSKTFRRKRRI